MVDVNGKALPTTAVFCFGNTLAHAMRRIDTERKYADTVLYVYAMRTGEMLAYKPNEKWQLITSIGGNRSKPAKPIYFVS